MWLKAIPTSFLVGGGKIEESSISSYVFLWMIHKSFYFQFLTFNNLMPLLVPEITATEFLYRPDPQGITVFRTLTWISVFSAPSIELITFD